MTSTTRFTFDDYLNYDDGTDKPHEFVGGELIEMPPESPFNSRISFFLALQFARFLPEERLCHKDTEIAVSGTQTQTRLPDLMILSEDLAVILGETNRGTITLEMPPPELIIEVVSLLRSSERRKPPIGLRAPGKSNEERDYRYKRSEYAARGVFEYWVIDPEASQVTVFTLNAGFYEGAEYTGEMFIKSCFEALQLTAAQIFNRKR